jgi:hypothetical protein
MDHRITFRLPVLGEGRTLDTLFELDLDGDGDIEYIVTSIDRHDGVPKRARADKLQIYSWHPASADYRPLEEDTLRWITGLDLRDVTGDGRVDLLVRCDGGGTDPIATEGLSIVSGDGGTIRRVLSLAHGAPEIAPLPSMTGSAILTHGRLWPPLVSLAGSVPYLEDLLGYRGGRFRSLRSEHPEKFLTLARGAEYNYRQLRQRHAGDTLRYTDSALAALRDSLVDEGSPLFTPAALVLLGYGRAGREESLRGFWRQEGGYLQRRMPTAQWTALNSIFERTVTEAASGDEVVQ